MFFEFLEETKDENLLICGKSAKLIFMQNKRKIQGKIQQVVFSIGQPKENERRAGL
jgi:hypothetical protein